MNTRTSTIALVALAIVSSNANAGPPRAEPSTMLRPGNLTTGVGPNQPVQIQGTCTHSEPIRDVSGQIVDGLVICANPRDTTFTFVSDGPGTNYALRMTAPAGHCSPIQYQIWTPGAGGSMYGKTRFMNRTEREVVPIGNSFARGNITVAIRVLGKMEGCNTGAISSWGGQVELFYMP